MKSIKPFYKKQLIKITKIVKVVRVNNRRNQSKYFCEHSSKLYKGLEYMHGHAIECLKQTIQLH